MLNPDKLFILADDFSIVHEINLASDPKAVAAVGGEGLYTTSVPYEGCYLWTVEPIEPSILECPSIGPNSDFIIPIVWNLSEVSNPYLRIR